MSGKRKQGKNRRKSDRRSRLIYGISILMLTALVGVAFYSPGWVFGFQDSRRCNDTVLEERENVDVAVLSTNYEVSFYQRMINFTENQTENTNYYVASEELTDYEQLQDFLESDHGLYKDSFLALVDAQLVGAEIFECAISAWKQYVIYSDDYAKGVNFILWYIELEHPDEAIGTYKLLLEADTGELYGLQADTGGTFYIYETKYDRDSTSDYDRDYARDSVYSLEDYLSYTLNYSNRENWMIFAYYYSGLNESDFFEFYELYNSAASVVLNSVYIDSEIAGTAVTDASRVYTADEYNELKLKLGIGEGDDQWFEFLRTYPAMVVWDEGNRLECNFPYGDGSLIFRLQMTESVPYPWTLHNLTIGFPAIYELIPEFD